MSSRSETFGIIAGPPRRAHGLANSCHGALGRDVQQQRDWVLTDFSRVTWCSVSSRGQGSRKPSADSCLPFHLLWIVPQSQLRFQPLLPFFPESGNRNKHRWVLLSVAVALGSVLPFPPWNPLWAQVLGGSAEDLQIKCLCTFSYIDENEQTCFLTGGSVNTYAYASVCEWVRVCVCVRACRGQNQCQVFYLLFSNLHFF